ncbi:hypothetical protein A2W39_03340, partial [Candidatus Azambacteria bacterium RIFCSPHIGHO2_01_46_10]
AVFAETDTYPWLSSPETAASSDILKNPVFKEILGWINRAYVDKDPDKEKMLEGALNGLLQSLDPNSRYISPEEAKMEQDEMRGKFYGIGLQIDKKDAERITVVSVFEGSPAEKAGIKAGDVIIKIRDDAGELTIVKSTTLQTIVKKIRGAKGTKVVLTIYRSGAAEYSKIEVTRDEIKIQNVIFKKIGNTGYVRLNMFNGTAARDVKKAIDELKTLGAKNMILDLRDNPGGLLDAVDFIASGFLPAGKTIVSIKNRDGAAETTFSDGYGFYEEGPLVVLVNGGSASASELLAAAIKENGRGKLVGTTTFGKGSVQRGFPLSNGGQLRLTVAKFYSPNGNVIHGKGVEPDIEVEITDPANFKPGEPEKDPQLKKALKILNGN